MHPESYEKAEKLLSKIGFKSEDLRSKEKLEQIRRKLKEINIEQTAKELEIGEMTLSDIIEELSKLKLSSNLTRTMMCCGLPQ